MASERDRKREEEGEGAPRIKVTDRRAFTRDGEPRQPDVEPGEPKAPPAGGPTRQEASRPEPGAERRHAGGPPPSIDFVAFVQSLYVSALMSLGEVENPYTHQFETNLDLARQNIDILTMLRAKTQGNLTAEEEGFLEQVVPQLQLLYVKKAG